jgi:hypothetical protein
MKKIIFLLFAFISLSVSAQMVTRIFANGAQFDDNQADYTLTNTTAGYTLYKAAMPTAATQDFIVKLDSISGNHTNVAVAVYGQKFDNSAFVQIGSTLNWKGTTLDTIIVFSNATANRYRNYKVLYTGTGTGVTKVDYQQFKLYTE